MEVELNMPNRGKKINGVYNRPESWRTMRYRVNISFLSMQPSGVALVGAGLDSGTPNCVKCENTLYICTRISVF